MRRLLVLHVLLLPVAVLAFDSPGFKVPDRVHVTSEPWFPERPVNTTAAEGRTATLLCVVESIGLYRLAWIHKDRHILLTLHDKVITRNPRVSIHHNNHRSWWLEISDVKREDSGQYMCQINTAPMIHQITHLEVVVAPSIDEAYTSTDLDVREGADVSLRCRATGSPDPVIKWRREEDKKIILGSKRVPSVEGEFLKLTRTSRLSMGAYLCIASNGVQPSVSKRLMLNVLFAPMILIPSQLIGAFASEDVTLVCNLESFPKSITYWVISKDIMIISNNKYRVYSEPSDTPASYKVKMLLDIKDLRPEDFGTYTCVAKNSLGETQGTIALYEKPRPATAVADEEQYTRTPKNKKEDSVKNIQPIANNIKLERTERREEAGKRHMTANQHRNKELAEDIMDLASSGVGSQKEPFIYITCMVSLFNLNQFLNIMLNRV